MSTIFHIPALRILFLYSEASASHAYGKTREGGLRHAEGWGPVFFLGLRAVQWFQRYGEAVCRLKECGPGLCGCSLTPTDLPGRGGQGSQIAIGAGYSYTQLFLPTEVPTARSVSRAQEAGPQPPKQREEVCLSLSLEPGIMAYLFACSCSTSTPFI